MSSIEQIKRRLEGVRDQLEAELNQVYEALAVFEKGGTTKPSSSGTRQKASEEATNRVRSVIEKAERPLRTTEVAERASVSDTLARVALKDLVRRDEAKQVGIAPGKGHIPVWGRNDMTMDLYPTQGKQQIVSIEQETKSVS